MITTLKWNKLLPLFKKNSNTGYYPFYSHKETSFTTKLSQYIVDPKANTRRKLSELC